MTDIIAQLDEAIEAKSLLKHPFYQAWSEGRLPIPMLQGYAAQYYHNELAFPTYLSAIHSRSSHIPQSSESTSQAQRTSSHQFQRFPEHLA